MSRTIASLPGFRQNGAPDPEASEPGAAEIGTIIAKRAVRPTLRRIRTCLQTAAMHQGDELVGIVNVHAGIFSCHAQGCNLSG